MPRSCLIPLSLLVACATENRLETHVVRPEAAILAPMADAVFRQGEGSIALEGIATDSKDEPSELKAWWIVDEGAPSSAEVQADDMVLGDLDPAALEIGPHVLHLRVQDSDDATAEASVAFVVEGPVEVPQVTITAPADASSFGFGDSITFQGIATDSWTPAADLAFSWSSDRDGALAGAVSADGSSVLVTAGLTEGFHEITLAVIDGDGEVGADSIHVSVAPQIVTPDPGDLVFSEMMIQPQVVADEVGEWVELYNTSGSTLDIGGYTFRDDDVDHWTLASPLLVAPHDYVVLCADIDPSVNGGVPCDAWFLRDYQGAGLALANNPDEVVLARPDGVEIDWLHYDSAWVMEGVAIGVNPSFQNATSNDDLAHWCFQTTVMTSGGEPGTPGAANDPCPTE